MNIKELRIQKGYSQEELANLSNLSTRTIQRIEKDNKGSKESLNAIANVFELKYEELKDFIEKEDTKSTSNKFDKKLIIFILVNLMLFIINITTSPEHLWFIYPLDFRKKYKKSITTLHKAHG